MNRQTTTIGAINQLRHEDQASLAVLANPSESVGEGVGWPSLLAEEDTRDEEVHVGEI